jgi:hypothetical protein
MDNLSTKNTLQNNSKLFFQLGYSAILPQIPSSITTYENDISLKARHFSER